MRIKYAELASRLNLSPLQMLVELAAMKQPWKECWPECDEGFEETIRHARRNRQGLPPAPRTFTTRPVDVVPHDAPLPVSEPAAAILSKLLMKGYGLKSVRVFTLTLKWVHGATEDHVRELIKRGNLDWTDTDRQAVNLVADQMADTERIVEAYRRRQQ